MTSIHIFGIPPVHRWTNDVSCQLCNHNGLYTCRQLKSKNHSITHPRYWNRKGSFSFNLKVALKIEDISSLTSSSPHDDIIVTFPIKPLSASSPLSRPFGHGTPEWKTSKVMQTTSLVTCFILLVENFLRLGGNGCWHRLCSEEGSGWP